MCAVQIFHSFFQNERADPMRPFRLVRNCHGYAIVRILAVGSEGFRAVEHPMIAVAHSGRSRAARVRTRLRLGQRPRPNRLPRSQRHKILLLLRSEEHTSELQSHLNLVCRLLLEKKKRTALSLQKMIRLSWTSKIKTMSTSTTQITSSSNIRLDANLFTT